MIAFAFEYIKSTYSFKSTYCPIILFYSNFFILIKDFSPEVSKNKLRKFYKKSMSTFKRSDNLSREFLASVLNPCSSPSILNSPYN